MHGLEGTSIKLLGTEFQVDPQKKKKKKRDLVVSVMMMYYLEFYWFLGIEFFDGTWRRYVVCINN